MMTLCCLLFLLKVSVWNQIRLHLFVWLPKLVLDVSIYITCSRLHFQMHFFCSRRRANPRLQQTPYIQVENGWQINYKWLNYSVHQSNQQAVILVAILVSFHGTKPTFELGQSVIKVMHGGGGGGGGGEFIGRLGLNIEESYPYTCITKFGRNQVISDLITVSSNEDGRTDRQRDGSTSLKL